MGATFKGTQLPDKTLECEFSPMTSMTSHEASKYQQYKETEDKEEKNCLFCGISSPKRKKESEVWRVDFEQCCNSLKEYRWAEVILKAGREKRPTRIDCMKEYTDLKYEFERKIQNKEVPNSSEVRKILSSSALLESNVGEEVGVGPCESLKSFAKASFFKGSYNKPSFMKGRKLNPMVSTLDQNMKSLFQPKKTRASMDDEMESSIFLFVKFSEMIEKHSQEPANALCKIRLSFVDYIAREYGQLTAPSRLEDEELINNIREFIEVYTIFISVYYKISAISENEKVRFIFSFENLKSVATVILFKSQGFYKMVFKLMAHSDRSFEEELRATIHQKSNVKPQDLRVSPQYCLNELTVNWYLSKCSFEACIGDIEIPTNSECDPFATCILKLKQIDQAQTPISKLKVIISTADKITSSINRFYEINNIPLQQMVDADQILTIFILIIVHSGVTTLKTHLRFIESFCTEEQLMSETGYYSKVAEGALSMLVNEADELEG